MSIWSRIRINLFSDCSQRPSSERCLHLSVLKPGAPSHRKLLALSTMAMLSVLLNIAAAQPSPSTDSDDASVAVEPSTAPEPAYVWPTQKVRDRNFVFDTFGPYPVAGSMLAAGVNQFSNAPPEWRQDAEGYAKRFGSNFGRAGVGTTTRYALAQLLREDALYYRCECSGYLPRVRHAILSTVTARRGRDGHRVFSLSAVLAPYAGSAAAVYGWYPDRYGAKDAFRLGNYNLLAFVGGNIALEFLYSGPHSLLSRMHLNNAHGDPEPGPNH